MSDFRPIMAKNHPSLLKEKEWIEDKVQRK